MIVVAVVGCCGAIGGSRLFLGVYGFAVLCLLVATVSCGIYILYKRDGIDVELSDALNYMVQVSLLLHSTIYSKDFSTIIKVLELCKKVWTDFNRPFDVAVSNKQIFYTPTHIFRKRRLFWLVINKYVPG